MNADTTREPEAIHRLKNYIAIVMGFSELLLAECADDDPKRSDLEEVFKAAQNAMAMMPELGRRMDETRGA